MTFRHSGAMGETTVQFARGKLIEVLKVSTWTERVYQQHDFSHTRVTRLTGEPVLNALADAILAHPAEVLAAMVEAGMVERFSPYQAGSSEDVYRLVPPSASEGERGGS